MTTVLDALERIQNIIDVPEENLTLLAELTQIQIDILSEKLGGIDVPDVLAFIVVETTIARYRKIGAEGMTNKQVDVIRNTYSEDLFEPYQEIINRHATRKADTSARIVRLI